MFLDTIIFISLDQKSIFNFNDNNMHKNRLNSLYQGQQLI